MGRRSKKKRKPSGPAPEGVKSRYQRKQDFCNRRGIDPRSIDDLEHKAWRKPS